MFIHNLLVLIYTKLHSKSCDYLYKAVKYAQGAQVWLAAQIFIGKHKKNDGCHESHVWNNWNARAHKNSEKETKVGRSRETRDFLNSELMKLQVSRWFNILFWALPKKVTRLNWTLWLTDLCDNLKLL